MQKLILKNFLSPGDIVMLTAAVRDLHQSYPNEFLTDIRTSCMELWENNPYLTPLDERDPEVRVLECHYPLIERSNLVPYHCLHGFVEYLNDSLGLQSRVTEFKGDIHLSNLEKSAASQIQELVGKEIPFWIVVAGGKFDVTIKWWESERYQAVVDHFKDRIQFVQVGEQGHHHPKLNGVIDLRGKTDLRELVRLIFHAQGVLCPITAMMHLAAAVPTRQGNPPKRACVVVAGGREPAHWVEYPHHQFIHTVGQLQCCAEGGCWKSRTVPLGDGDQRDGADWLCLDVLGKLPRCMHMITPAEVIRRVEGYFQGGAIRYLTADEAIAGAKGVKLSAATKFVSQSQPKRSRPKRPLRGIIIQQGSGMHTQLLDLNNQIHTAYAAKHDFTFWSVRGDVQSERHPCWNKIMLIHMAFAADFEFVAWLDADTLIVNSEVDLRNGLPEGAPIGMCRRLGGWGDPAWHYNSGVIFSRNTRATRTFFLDVWNAGPVDHPWHEQIRINEVWRANQALIQTLDPIWNFQHEEAGEPVILGWHGQGQKAIALMKRALAERQPKRAQKNGAYHPNRQSIRRVSVTAANPRP